MISLTRPRIKARIYSGFGALILIGLAVAAFGGWELAKLGSQVDRFSSISDNAARNLEVSHLSEILRRAAVRFKAMGDESQVKEFDDAQAKAMGLLATAGKMTTSQDRRVLYGEVSAK